MIERLDASAASSTTLRRLGRYTLLGRIARGGMAELQLARADGPAGFEKLVALKLVLPHLADDPQFIAMFLDEARLAARLDHPNIAHVLDLDLLEGRHVIVMEYVHGRDLRAVLTAAARHGGLPLPCALSIVRDTCAALHYAHELRGPDGRSLGIVHRDVSPQNLVIRYDGVTKLVDFGVAKASTHSSVTRTGMLKGKLGYMSPEHCLGKPIDRRSDIFALGVVSYEATTGVRLFHADNEAAVINRILEGRFERPSEVVPGYPAALEAVILRALQRDPSHRFATAQEMLVALDEAIGSLGARASHATVGEQMTALFGDVPVPSHELDTVPGHESLRSRTRSRASRGWGRTAALALSVGAVLSVAGYVLGSTNGREGEVAPTNVESVAPTSVSQQSARSITAAPVVATPAPAPTKTATAPVEPPSAAAPSKPVAKPRDAKPRKRRPSASSSPPRSKSGKPKPGSSADSMMPRG